MKLNHDGAFSHFNEAIPLGNSFLIKGYISNDVVVLDITSLGGETEEVLMAI